MVLCTCLSIRSGFPFLPSYLHLYRLCFISYRIVSQTTSVNQQFSQIVIKLINVIKRFEQQFYHCTNGLTTDMRSNLYKWRSVDVRIQSVGVIMNRQVKLTPRLCWLSSRKPWSKVLACMNLLRLSCLWLQVALSCCIVTLSLYACPCLKGHTPLLPFVADLLRQIYNNKLNNKSTSDIITNWRNRV